MIGVARLNVEGIAIIEVRILGTQAIAQCHPARRLGPGDSSIRGYPESQSTSPDAIDCIKVIPVGRVNADVEWLI